MYTLILVDYNSIECAVSFVQQCLDKLKTDGPLEVVLVDNGTRTDSLSHLQAKFKICRELSKTVADCQLYWLGDEKLSLVYCHSNGNIGYARGNNLGMRIADEIFDNPYYIISNNDMLLPTSIDLHTVTKRFEADPQMGLLGPKVVGTDGVPQTPRKKQSAFKKLIAGYWGVGPLRKFVDDISYDAIAGPSEWVTGCFFFLRRDAVTAAGGFDENTFLYAEEMILSARLRAMGYTTVYDPLFTVIHDHRETARNSPQTRRTIRISFASNCYYYKTYCATSAALLLFARCSFALYMLLFPLWQRLKRKC